MLTPVHETVPLVKGAAQSRCALQEVMKVGAGTPVNDAPVADVATTGEGDMSDTLGLPGMPFGTEVRSAATRASFAIIIDLL